MQRDSEGGTSDPPDLFIRLVREPERYCWFELQHFKSKPEQDRPHHRKIHMHQCSMFKGKICKQGDVGCNASFYSRRCCHTHAYIVVPSTETDFETDNRSIGGQGCLWEREKKERDTGKETF